MIVGWLTYIDLTEDYIRNSVANPGCLSRILDLHKRIEIAPPGSVSRIRTYFSTQITYKGIKKAPDPGSGSSTIITKILN
jgi:hypothetical protein